MRSPLLGLFAALAALTPGGLFGATPPASVVLDLPTRERDRPLDHVAPREHLAPVVTVAPEPVEPPRPTMGPSYHRVWCPDCAGRGAEARRQYTAKELRKRTSWVFSHAVRRSMASDLFRDEWKSGYQLPAEEVLRVL